MNAEQQFLTTHRAHDYKELMRRWRRIARPAGLRVVPVTIHIPLDDVARTLSSAAIIHAVTVMIGGFGWV